MIEHNGPMLVSDVIYDHGSLVRDSDMADLLPCRIMDRMSIVQMLSSPFLELLMLDDEEYLRWWLGLGR